ncbi:hypothetical protein [Leptothermofonsia sp. ETS-13]|uniref:hypothetical protein n=1 Tax=Leptothermofonsia sp. ETS-13 TaxID=3035696 RepID=UPI003BA0CCFB
MVHLSRYWEILRLDPASQGRGYRRQSVAAALEFFQEQFPDMATIANPATTISPDRAIQALLFSLFRATKAELVTVARAGLCLRCYVSYPILYACKKIARQLSASGRFTYQELLPFVLNDDGRSLIILGEDRKTQLVLNEHGAVPLRFPVFTVEVLRKFDSNSPTHSRLDTWVYYQTRQNQDIKDFLSERGLSYLSDWALLNRARMKQLATLLPAERQIVEAFHAVYRRDRRHAHAIAVRCPDPTPAQLQEMLTLLQKADSSVRSPDHLQRELQRIAKQLRQYAVWNRSGPVSEALEVTHPEIEIERELPDPNTTNALEDLERQEVREFCHCQLMACLDWGICQTLREQLNHLKQRPRYASLASKFVPALQLIYVEGWSQSEVASRLEMTNQSQVSRIVNIKNLLSQVRLKTTEKLVQSLLDMASYFNPGKISSHPDYLRNLMVLVEDFADVEVFQAAATEIMTTKNRSLNSVYAQRLRYYIQKPQEWEP